MSTATSVANRSATEQVLQWLALGLTPGLEPTRVRHLVEHFGNVAAIFRASLTELEATGLLAVSAQSLGTGKSLELAQEELGKASAAGVQIVTLDDPDYPRQLRQIYDPPRLLYVRGDAKGAVPARDRRSWHSTSKHPTDRAWRSDCPSIWGARVGHFQRNGTRR